MNTLEFEFDPWRLRAILCSAVVDGELWTGDGPEDVWLWFVGDPILDEWFAHGLSDTCHSDLAEMVADSINDREMLALLAYAGETWADIVAISPVAFANQQRALFVALQGVPIERLMGMTRDQILILRKAETTPIDPDMN